MGQPDYTIRVRSNPGRGRITWPHGSLFPPKVIKLEWKLWPTILLQGRVAPQRAEQQYLRGRTMFQWLSRRKKAPSKDSSQRMHQNKNQKDTLRAGWGCTCVKAGVRCDVVPGFWVTLGTSTARGRNHHFISWFTFMKTKLLPAKTYV